MRVPWNILLLFFKRFLGMPPFDPKRLGRLRLVNRRVRHWVDTCVVGHSEWLWTFDPGLPNPGRLTEAQSHIAKSVLDLMTSPSPSLIVIQMNLRMGKSFLLDKLATYLATQGAYENVAMVRSVRIPHHTPYRQFGTVQALGCMQRRLVMSPQFQPDLVVVDGYNNWFLPNMMSMMQRFRRSGATVICAGLITTDMTDQEEALIQWGGEIIRVERVQWMRKTRKRKIDVV